MACSDRGRTRQTQRPGEPGHGGHGIWLGYRTAQTDSWPFRLPARGKRPRGRKSLASVARPSYCGKAKLTPYRLWSYDLCGRGGWRVTQALLESVQRARTTRPPFAASNGKHARHQAGQDLLRAIRRRLLQTCELFGLAEGREPGLGLGINLYHMASGFGNSKGCLVNFEAQHRFDKSQVLLERCLINS